jgi:predicted transcriptional regulator
MTTATISIRRDARAALRAAARGIAFAARAGRQGGTHFTFSSAEQLFRAISPKRWELIECLQNTGEISVRGLARELDRDVKRVHEDVQSLIELGLIARTDSGKIHVPFDKIHIDCDLSAAA